MRLEKVQITDRQKHPFVMIPKVFFTRFKPSLLAIGAYTAIKYFASNKTGTSEYTSIPTMAALVDLSNNSFKKGVNELVKKGTLRVRHRTRKTPGGNRLALPNLYEILDLDDIAESGEDDAPI
jgi:hypothetical protein